MLCYQCEQTAKGTGCTAFGVCGKDPETAALQDLTIYALKGLAAQNHRLRNAGGKDPASDSAIIEGLFTTITNVNFDPERLQQVLTRIHQAMKSSRQKYVGKGLDPSDLPDSANWKPADNMDDLIRQGESVTFENRINSIGEDLTALQELITYGLKGSAAYVDHAKILGYEDEEIYSFFHEAMDKLNDPSPDMGDLLGLSLKVGEVNLKVMEMLDRAHTETFGHPAPTKVRVTPVKGKAILISGHDLLDMKELLEQTKGTGIKIYTHGEMLPAHGYPELNKYDHLAGNYGGAWQDQRKEFDEFPGAILMTTNCIQKPKGSYMNRIFTCGLVAWPGVTHISNRDFTQVIEMARLNEGFKEDAPEKLITVGFGHNAVMSVADKVIQAVKDGKIKHFFLVGGCDGAKSGRNYYTEFAKKVPDDCVILTLACGKFRFNKLEFGDIGGIPRLLDVGQCNDAHSAIAIASALAGAFDCGVNDLPLSMILSWYEQKAVAILLSLLHLGITDIRLGPTLPAFVTPAMLKVLVDKFNIKPITTPDEDLAAILKPAKV